MTTRPNSHRNLPLLACCASPRTTWWAGWIATASLLLAGCGSSPPVPDWQLQIRQAADRATTAELTGHARVAEADWQRAQQQAARSALPEAVARVHLAHCAARRASLDWSPCEGLEALLPDAGAPLQAYARYLAGQPQAGDAELLPLAQQPVARYVAQHSATLPRPSMSPGLSMESDPPPSSTPLLTPPPRLTAETVADPLSRLVAASALVRAGQGSPEVVAMAVDTASAQGWTRPLLAWLGWSAQRAEAAGQTTEAQRLRRRMALLAPPPAPLTAPALAPAPEPVPTSGNGEPR